MNTDPIELVQTEPQAESATVYRILSSWWQLRISHGQSLFADIYFEPFEVLNWLRNICYMAAFKMSGSLSLKGLMNRGIEASIGIYTMLTTVAK